MGHLTAIASDLSAKLEAGDIPGTDSTRSDLLWYTLNNIADTVTNSDARYDTHVCVHVHVHVNIHIYNYSC